MARTTVRMPFSGSTRPTMPTIGSSGRLLSRALHPASGGPGWNRSGSTAWGMMRRRRRAGAHGVGHGAADGHRARRQSHRRPQHDAAQPRAHEVVELEHHRSPSQPAREGAVEVAPQAVGMDDIRVPGQARQPPGAPAGDDHLVPQRPHAGTSVTGRPQPEAWRGGELHVLESRRRPRLGQGTGRRRQRQRNAALAEQWRQAEQAAFRSPHLGRGRDDEDAHPADRIGIGPRRTAVHRSTVDHMVDRSPRA